MLDASTRLTAIRARLGANAYGVLLMVIITDAWAALARRLGCRCQKTARSHGIAALLALAGG